MRHRSPLAPPGHDHYGHSYAHTPSDPTSAGLFTFTQAGMTVPSAIREHARSLPHPHDRVPLQTLLATLTIQEAMQAYSARLPRNKNIAFRLRIGVNTGLVVVGRIGDNLRMDYTAQGDTTRLTQGYFTFRSLGARQIKGRTAVEVLK